MSHRASHTVRRPGMTLVELLVVIGVLLLLLVSVVPILSPTADQKGREAAATVLSMINRAKLRAEANGDVGAGIWLEPLITGTANGSLAGPANGNIWWQLDGRPLPMATLDMFACEPQNAYNGDDPDAARVLIYPINGNPPDYQFATLPATDYLALFEENACVFIRNFCTSSSQITADSAQYYFRLLTEAEQGNLQNNHPDWFPRPYRACNAGLSSDRPDFVNPDAEPVPNTYYSGTPATAPRLVIAWVRDRQPSVERRNLPTVRTPFDTTAPTWPVSALGRPFAVQRPNVRSPTPPLTVPEGYAIDVSWSSHGTQLLHNAVDVRAGQGGMTLLSNFLANQPVQFMFDRGGGLKKVVYKAFLAGFGGGQGAMVEQALEVPADVFLLVGRADRVGLPYVANPTEASPGANWQYPDSRWVKISHLTGKTLIADPVLDATNVYDSQGYARADVSAVRN